MAEDEKKDLPEAKIKPSTGRLFWKSFIMEDFGIVKDYLLFDVLVPAIKDTIVDASCSAINMIFNGDAGKRRTYGRGWNQSYSKTDYGTIYRTTQTGKFNPDRERRSYEEPVYSNRFNQIYMDLIFENRVDAEDCLDQLREIVEQYNQVTVADYYEIYEQVTKTKVPAAARRNWQETQNFGWSDLSQVIVTGRRGEYYLTLPRTAFLG